MPVSLKFRDVVVRGGLDAQTAQYVLKQPKLLPGMPKAGSQGRHRVFDPHQAVMLALSTHLVAAGIPLGVGVRVVRHCLDTITHAMPPAVAAPGALEENWVLEILDGRYARCALVAIERGKARLPPFAFLTAVPEESGEFTDIKTGKRCLAPPTHLQRYTLNLSELERRILGETS